ncbi:MAG: CAP domain-containing protein [Chloroflexi bacterium]|nr:CAP domain-containing protein [Chloroflexota bacterium]MYK35148.1 CAP domain-containing protein [Chloroflexota bacterium]
MPNGGEHYERLGVCPLCGSHRIRIRQQRHQNLLWRCRSCNGVFRTPTVRDYILPPGDDGRWSVFAEDIPRMERRGTLRAQPGSRSARGRNRGSRRQSHGLCWAVVIVVAAAAVIAAYFALEENADFLGADTIRTIAEEASEANPEAQTGDIDGTAARTSTEATPEADIEARSGDIEVTTTGFHDTEDEREQFSDPVQRHLALKELMVQLTNEQRAGAGVPPVRLGSNGAAQLHAEAALQGCYSSHWDQWGLKPNHRYTLSGGTGADGENGRGSDYCIASNQGYRPIDDMHREIGNAIKGWMASPGHRRNLLDPAHTILNVGIAHDQFNVMLVQHFSSDYVSYTTKPTINSEGVLTLQGEVSGATLNIVDTVNVSIAYDVPPTRLTRGQLAYTYSLCNPVSVGYVVEPLLPGWSFSTPDVRTDSQVVRCVDPYQTPADRPAPSSPEQAHNAWASAKAASESAQTIITQKRRIVADRMDIASSAFDIRADLTTVLKEHGPGVYTVLLWGRPDHMQEPTPLSKQSLFWLIDPPKESPYLAATSTNHVDG